MDCCCSKFYAIGGLLIGLYLLKLYIRKGRYTEPTLLDNKIAIITGANTGIGKENAIDFAKRGAKVYIACRDINRGNAALDEIRKISGSEKVYFLQLNLASLNSIREFSKKFHQLENKLDILINNAGVMACPKAYTEDGFEMQIGTNHLGHFLLTHLLLDLLKAGAPSRIVNVSSRAYIRGEIHCDDFMLERGYTPLKAYSQSKLANILFTRKLAQVVKKDKIIVNSCHPGIVDTEISRHFPYIIALFIKIISKIYLKTPNEGAQTQIRLAIDPELEDVTGKYFSDCQEVSPLKRALDDEAAEWLWNKSMQLVGL